MAHARTYHFDAIRPGGYMNWRGRCWATSNARIRVVVCHLFRAWFGHAPSEHWHADGFMAEAWDRHGNRILVEQINRDMTPIALLPAHAESVRCA